MGEPSTSNARIANSRRALANSRGTKSPAGRQVHHIAGEAIALEQGTLALGALAQEKVVAESHLLTFRLAQQTFALSIDTVNEIIEMVTMLRLPRASEVIEGVINLHGAPVPILNLREALNLPSLPPHLHTPIIIGRVTGTMVGLIVDEVIDVLSVPTATMTPANSIFGQSLPISGFLSGVIYSQGSSILLLDIDQILGEQTAEVFQQVMALIASDEQILRPEKNDAVAQDSDQASNPASVESKAARQDSDHQ
jgi:purine-binding chemotaxis protein CheW